MKLYTASYWEPEVHGPGRKIGFFLPSQRIWKKNAAMTANFVMKHYLQVMYIGIITKQRRLPMAMKEL